MTEETNRSAPRSFPASGFTRFLVVLFLLVPITFFVMIASLAGMLGRFAEDTSRSRPHLVQLRLEGPIFDGDPHLTILDRLSRDENCKGILLRVDSPGGAVGASQEIYAALRRLRDGGMPVVASHGNIAASGGYYVSLAGQRIFANPGTLTGSIGVIFQFPEFGELMEKTGVSLHTVKSGSLKDVGSPARKPTEEELRFLQYVLDDTHEQFVADVAAARGIPGDSARGLADGRIFTGRQALAVGLIDTLGGIDPARDHLIALAGVPDDIQWVKEPRPRSRIEEFLNPDTRSGWAGLVSAARQRLNPGTFFLWP